MSDAGLLRLSGIFKWRRLVLGGSDLKALVTLALSFLLLLPPTAHADDKFWNNFFGGAFNSGNNWSGGVPGVNDVAHFGITNSPLTQASYTVDFDISPTNQAVKVEDDRVAFDLNGHTYITTADSGSQVGNVSGRTGQLTITDGTWNFPALKRVDIGVSSGNGTLVVGTGGLISGVPALLVGSNGVGTLTVQDGGDITYSAAGVGPSVGLGSSGTVNVTGAGSTITGGSWSLGGGSSGMLNITAGGSVQTPVGALVEIGDSAGSTGTVNVQGPVSNWTNAANLLVGSAGDGTLNISAGGSVTSADATIGADATSTGAATVTGTGSQWTTAGFFVGSFGHGTVNVSAGGHLNTANAVIGSEMGSVGDVTVDGANSIWASSSFIFLSGFGPGTGSLTVTNGGAVSAQSGLSVRPLGTLRGDGQITGNVTNSGVVAPGSSPGTLHVNGDYTQTAGGTAQIEIGGTTAGSQFDTLDVSDKAMLHGTLDVSLIDNFVPSIGNVFQVVHAAGGIFGGFDTLSLPAIPNGRGWAIVYTGLSVFLSVESAPLLGDYNQNGIVDAADYTVWRDTLGSTTDLRANGDNTGASAGKIDQADYDFWKSHYGNHAGSGAGATAAVPEPATLGMLVAGILMWCCRRRSTGQKYVPL